MGIRISLGFSLLLLLTPINYKFNTYKIVISIHCHFSFGIYLETKRVANEMQGRLSTLAKEPKVLLAKSL